MEELTTPKTPLVLTRDQNGVNWQIGRQLMTRYGGTYTITEIYENDKGQVIIAAVDQDDKEITKRETLKEWLSGNYYTYLPDTKENLQAEALKALADPDYLDSLDIYGGSGPESPETALATRSTPAQIETMRDHGLVIQQRVTAMQVIIEQMMYPMRQMASRMAARIGHLENMMDVLAAYTGMYEAIEQIAAGEPASAETPIAIRQLILYMDEEAGITDWLEGRQGISWKSVDAFDQWLTADLEHIQQVIPEARGIVALKPSRQNRDSGDWWKDMEDRAENKATYILYRNGQNLYRVWTGFALGDLLYPKNGEYLEIAANVQAEKDQAEDEYKWQGIELGWKRNIAMLQGAIERTAMFHPITPGINLFDPNTLEGAVTLIRDGEALLTDGRLPFRKWQAEINARIARGDRIYVAPHDFGYKREDWADRLTRYTRNPPPPPPPGVYNIDRVEVRKSSYSNSSNTHLIVIYMPDQEVWTAEDGYQDRKRGEGFIFRPYDSFILRYDDIDVETLEYYIKNRLDRQNYLKMLPVLRGLLKTRRQEKAVEDEFVKLISSELDVAESVVHQKIDWWKVKVIMKRPLTADDAKAWRMIRQEIKKG